MVYRIGPGWAPDLLAIETALDKDRFAECGASQEMSVGWTEPRGVANGPLLESIGGQLILKLMFESKAVPSSVIKRKSEERLAQIEATTGRKPGKKERKEISEEDGGFEPFKRAEAEAAGKTFIYNQVTRMTMRNSLTLPEDEVKRLLKPGGLFVDTAVSKLPWRG